MRQKGIILAGGSGTRLFPATKAISKQLLPIYDKPMVYYPLSTLMLAGVRHVLIISSPFDLPLFKHLLGDGHQLGIQIKYAVQPSPDGIAQGLIIAEEFLAGAPSILILGDNLFYGHSLENLLEKAASRSVGATIFGYHVNDPERYGVVRLNSDGKVIDIVEKPSDPPSNFAVTGLYFYDGHAPELAKKMKPSHRGELEITDLNKLYLEKGLLEFQALGRGHTWMDTGTHEAMLEAQQFVHAIQQKQGLMVACPEEIAFRQNWISTDALLEIAKPIENHSYGKYLVRLSREATR